MDCGCIGAGRLDGIGPLVVIKEVPKINHTRKVLELHWGRVGYCGGGETLGRYE